MELKTLFRGIADAIREKDGSQGEITAAAFPERIRAIPAGGITLDRLELSAPPAKTAYRVGEVFDPAGMVVTAVYSNGARLDVAGCAVEPAGPLAAGVGAVTVRYGEGGVTATLAVAVTVSRITVGGVPSQKGALTYTGAPLSPEWEGYDPAQLTLDGVSSATDAGSYGAVFTPREGYQWPDGTTAAKTIPWVVGKAAGSLSLGATAVALCAPRLTAEVAVTRAGDGAVTAESSNPAVAAVSVSGSTVTIRHVNQTNGSATVTIRVAEGTNHTAPAAKTVAVTAKFLAAKKALDDMTWAEIREISDAGQGSAYWNVGDRKAVLVKGTVGTLSVNQTLYAYILGFDHNSAREGKGIQFGTFKSALSGGVDVCLVDGKLNEDTGSGGTKNFAMNHWGSASAPYNTNYGGWKGCDARYDILGSTRTAPSGYGRTATASRTGYDAPANTATSPVANTLMAALPADLRAVMKPITKYTDNGGGGANDASQVTASVDYLPLPAEFEIFGTGSFANSGEKSYQARYAYYAAGNSRLKYRHDNTGTAARWMQRSPHYKSAMSFCVVSSIGDKDYTNARTSIGLAPVFMV